MCSIFIEFGSKPSSSDGDTCASLLSNVRPDRPHIPSFFQRFQRASFLRSIRRRRVVGSPPPVKGVLWRFPKCCNRFFAFSVDFFFFFVTSNYFNGLGGHFPSRCPVSAASRRHLQPESGHLALLMIHPQALFLLRCAKQMWKGTQYTGERIFLTQDICMRASNPTAIHLNQRS